LFLATSLLLVDPALAGPSEPRAHYLRVAPRFFSIMAALMLWMIGVDFVLGEGFTAAGAWNAVALVVFVVLARSQGLGTHIIATGLTWALLVSLLASRSLGVA